MKIFRRALFFITLGLGLFTIGRAAEPKQAENGRSIEAVLLDQKWGAGIAGSMILIYRPVVLFSDGNYTRDVEHVFAPDYKLSGRWKRQGDSYNLQESGGGRAKSIAAKLTARPGTKLQGRYTSFSAVGGGAANSTTVSNSATFDFKTDGTVRIDNTTGSSNSNVASAANKATAARYTLDQYRLTLQSPDGKTERLLFYFFPDSDRTIGLGSRTLSMD